MKLIWSIFNFLTLPTEQLAKKENIEIEYLKVETISENVINTLKEENKTLNIEII